MSVPRQITLPIHAASDDAHVQSNTTLIGHAATLAGSGFMAVLGCGRCAEVPVRHLGMTFDQIDLVDLDDDALKFIETRCQEWPEVRDICVFYHADLTGLISQIESGAQAIIARAHAPQSCLDHLGELLTSLAPNFWKPPEARRYNYIVCSGVLTQLQASVRKSAARIFSARFPEHIALMSSYLQWKKSIWNFARRLEEVFIDHLESLSAPGAIVYLSDTVHVCWLLQSGPQTFTTEGAWIATRTSRLADYLRPWNRIIAEHRWNWFRREQEGAYWGRLYGVQAIIYRPHEVRT